MAGKDLRRMDVRTSALRYPYWLDSKIISYKDAGDEIVLFDFPAKYGDKQVLILEAYLEILVGFAGTGVTLNIGAGTIANEDFKDGDTVTVVDADEYIDQVDITQGTAGYYWPASGDFLTAKAAGTGAARLITCADTSIPVIYAGIGGSGHTAGLAVAHFLVTVCPNHMD
jgi:hypothetical protein